jgi:hypothetical protein
MREGVYGQIACRWHGDFLYSFSERWRWLGLGVWDRGSTRMSLPV